MGRLFGTDGARGVANSQLTVELAINIGRAAALVLASHTHNRPKLLIGKDTRVSSDMLENALVAGLCSVGADAILVGVVPTPATAFLIRELGADAGVMISASHNPCEYNGLKLFDKDGYKLPDSLEEEIESIVLDGTREYPVPVGGALGRVSDRPDGVEIYVNHLLSTTTERFDGMKIALDCANGSSSVTARNLFTRLGAECLMVADQPDGVNINENCGSTHIDQLAAFVKANGCDAGLAFDGDADRCLAVDHEGNIVDGDRMIAVAALDLKNRGLLKGDTAVMTVMSNLGFFRFAEKNGIEVRTTKVGDRYVLEEMKKEGFSVGGEQSGHIIFLDYATTGDGQLSGVQILSVMKRTGKTLKELASVMEVYPQVLVNIKVTPEIKAVYADHAGVKASIAAAEAEMGNTGRVLVRASGTEPLVRVMLEGKDKEQITCLAQKIAREIEKV